ncbi:Ig-like domain-containing protein [Hymenobacter sp. ASUV-10]|uniref:Ig-like domain-containing protein n=1 Tax=Hymenobacter aranciens TaxID=3063996 RepID=A0ABT9BA17_9BACT|nr:Ig-like domain-containing protein [Hymenobacter sp. ASUV-10]MDO7873536.1 Ig-like domain-containing protein [Hymenobacter sp. ASUV-10]
MKNRFFLPWALAVLFLFVGPLAGRPAWAGPLPARATQPLAEALNPDGTLRDGLTGSFDPTGFRMKMAPDGRPVFRPTRAQGAGDADWQDGFVLPGSDWPVYAVASSGTDVYIGGLFRVVGTTAANYVARWNGSTWSALGSGVGGIVRALAVSGSTVYAGGEFTTAGGAPANYVARWNGTTWSPLGTGTNSHVQALAVSGSEVYAGGNFTTAGGAPARYIARWSGTAWSALGAGTNDAVRALALSGTDVYVAGSFTQAGGAAANYIARWSGSAWSPLGAGLNSVVTALAASGSDVYAAGYFSTAGAVSANRVARWNGTAWSALGAGVGTGTEEAPRCLALSGSTLYVGGDFSVAGGGAAKNVARWNGSGWSALGAGTSYIVGALALSGADVYAGGNFTTAGPVAALFIAKYSGSTWSTLTTGLNDAVLALAVSGNDVYLAGNFTAAGGIAASRIVKYNNGTWTPLGTGLSDAVYTMTLSGPDLYVGGNFLLAGGITANRVARWDGSAWNALGSGAAAGIGGTANLAVRALAVSGSDVYVGGEFTTAGGAPASRIARYNNGTWSTLGTGMNTTVYALALSGTDVYAGGDFTLAGGVAVSRIARWDGSAWSALGAGVNNRVYKMAFSGTTLYAGGTFTTAGGAAANRIARWNGTAWSALGTGVSGGEVQTLVVRGPEVYAGGYFSTAGGVAVNRIARWNGSAWSSLGTGLGGPNGGGVFALAVGADGKLNVGSSLLTVGDASKVTAYFARYTLAPVNELPVIAAHNFSVAENSAAGTAVGTVTATDPEGQPLTYSITAGNTGGTFAIDPSTGAITVANPAALDFETMLSFALTVTASDGPGSGSATVTVTLTDVGENGPQTFLYTTASSPTSTSPIPVMVVFTVPVTGFAATDVVVGNGTISNFAALNGGTDYTFDITPTAAGTVTVNIAANVAQNDTGDGNQTAQQLSLEYVLPPSAVVSIARLLPSPSRAAAVTYRVTFTRPITGITLARFGLTATGVTGASIGSLTGAGTTYTVTVNTGSGNGTLQLRLASTTGLSPAPNNAPFFGEVYTIDKAAPTATISSPASPATSTTPVPVTVTFSEDVVGFADTDVVLGNGTISNFAGSGATYTFDVAPTANGPVTVDVPAGAATDAATNSSTAAAQLSILYGAPITAVVWNGSVSTDWFATANWTPAVVPNSTIDATIPAGMPRYPVLASGLAAAQILTLAPGGSLGQSGGTLELSTGWANDGTFAATGGLVSFNSAQSFASITGSSLSTFWNLTVGGAGVLQNPNPGGVAVRRVLQLNSFFVTVNNPFTLLSDADGTAMVVHNGGNLFGRVTVQRYVAPDRNAGRGYRHLSAPVSNGTVADLAVPGATPVVNTAYNTSATPGLVAPFPTVYGYDQARLATATNNLAAFDKGWASPAALTDALTPGRAYTVNLPAASTLTFAGNLTTGDLPQTLTRNADATAAEAGWHLLGNPYPAPLNYSLVFPSERPGLDAAMYVYESTSQYGGMYRSYLPPVGSAPGIGNPMLAMGQGFFVRVSAGQTSGSLTFHDYQRATSYQNPTFHRSTPDLRPRLQLSLQGATGPADALQLYAEAAASSGFDAQFDAAKLPNPNGLNLATLTASGEALSIDGQPDLAGTVRIPLSVGVPAPGRYTLTVSALDNVPAGTTLTLHDALLNTRTLLATGTTCTFGMTSYTAPGRFWLSVAPAGALATGSPALAAPVLAYPNPAHGRLTVLRPVGPAATGELLNSLGQKVRELALPGAETVIDLHGLAAGVYTLRLRLDGQTIARRVVVN